MANDVRASVAIRTMANLPSKHHGQGRDPLDIGEKLRCWRLVNALRFSEHSAARSRPRITRWSAFRIRRIILKGWELNVCRLEYLAAVTRKDPRNKANQILVVVAANYHLRPTGSMHASPLPALRGTRIRLGQPRNQGQEVQK